MTTEQDNSSLVAMVEVIAKSLVDAPLEVSVESKQGENTTVILLKVAKTDIGKIIGKEGKTVLVVFLEQYDSAGD
jgi:predicted RNA-binding protein YlqC (UPF0109 family)